MMVQLICYDRQDHQNESPWISYHSVSVSNRREMLRFWATQADQKWNRTCLTGFAQTVLLLRQFPRYTRV
jgi:hypothetical protein